jgi:holliday junction DNA helicase RuvA
MIGSLRGQLIDRSLDGEALVEVAGVGYRVTMTPIALSRLGEIGADVFVFVHHHVREDAETLYGFPTREERDVYEVLLGAHGVGPALALAILGVHSPSALRHAVADNDRKAFTMVSGVGPKTAERLLLELRNRLDVPIDGGAPVVGAAGTGAVNGTASAMAHVREALAGLGYESDEIRAATSDLDTMLDASVLLKQALQRLANRAAF